LKERPRTEDGRRKGKTTDSNFQEGDCFAKVRLAATWEGRDWGRGTERENHRDAESAEWGIRVEGRRVEGLRFKVEGGTVEISDFELRIANCSFLPLRT